MRSKSPFAVWKFRELLWVLVWKEIVVRYKQAYLGVAWTVLKPVMLMLVFTLMRGFIGIESGPVPYPVLTFAALIPWVFFQEGVSLGIMSVVVNAPLVKKIYFPREVFPLMSVLTKVVEFGVDILVLLGLMLWYGMYPQIHMIWLPVLVMYLVLTVLSISLLGAALNVFYRDVSQLLPVAISLLMYASPIIYPLSLVKEFLLEKHGAQQNAHMLYFLYTANPLVGIIDGFQRTILHGLNPDPAVMLPGMLFVMILLPISYTYFKRKESFFADIV